MTSVPTEATTVKPPAKGASYWFKTPLNFDDCEAVGHLRGAIRNPLAALYVVRLWRRAHTIGAVFCGPHSLDAIEAACRWTGRRHNLADALVDCGFLVRGDDCYRIVPAGEVCPSEWLGTTDSESLPPEDRATAKRARARARAQKRRDAVAGRRDAGVTKRDDGVTGSVTGSVTRHAESVTKRDENGPTRARETETETETETLPNEEHSSDESDAHPTGQADLIPTDTPKAAPSSASRRDRDREAEVTRVLTRWRDLHATPASAIDGKAGEKRRKRVRQRLAEGTTADECLVACEGATRDDWLMGRDPKSPRAYRDVETILRDRTQVERLVALVTGAGPPAAAPASPTKSYREPRAYDAPPVPPPPKAPWRPETELLMLDIGRKLGRARRFTIPLGERLPDGWDVSQIPTDHLPILDRNAAEVAP